MIHNISKCNSAWPRHSLLVKLTIWILPHPWPPQISGREMFEFNPELIMGDDDDDEGGTLFTERQVSRLLWKVIKDLLVFINIS